MTYASPTDLDDALAIAADGAAQVIAGGTDVFPATGQGQHAAAYLDVTRIAGMRGISLTDDHYRIGGATTWTDVIATPLPAAFDALKAAAREVGSVQIQNVGTVAGNLCNASPAADGVPPLLVLDALVELTSAARGARQVALSDYITDVRRTVRAPDELLTAILIPRPADGTTSAFEKLGSRRYLVISITMTAVNVLVRDGRIMAAAVAVGAASPVAQRLPALEAALVGQMADDVLIDPAHLGPLSPIDDVRGTADYRWDVVATQIARAVRKAVA